jgi:hypothetical protein
MAFHPIELVYEWETLTNRPCLRRKSGAAWIERWAAQPASTAALAPLDRNPELMIVLTTFARPEAAARLLSGLALALERASLTERSALLVLHDACGQDYSAARQIAEKTSPRLLWLDARERFGKVEFWKVHQTALSCAHAWQPRLTLYLQDDAEFEADLVTAALELWRATERDLRRRVLYLFSSKDDEASGRWVRFERRDFGACRLTNWFDLQAFLVDRAFFELLDYRMVPIHENRWRRQPTQSSGVGRQFTRRLFGRAHVYQSWPPLVVHGAAPSMMNPEARQQRSLDNRADWSPRNAPPLPDRDDEKAGITLVPTSAGGERRR